MKIAVLSGKGGTGKTFISVNLASVLGEGTYIDCDVEAPNGYLFFKPVWRRRASIDRKIPEVNHEQCVACRACVDFCKFNALAYVGNQVMVFDEVCHSCGGCSLVCKTDAISEKGKSIGEVKYGQSLDTQVITGFMKIKEANGIPIIDRLLESVSKEDKVIVDCPPGADCSVMESIKDVDYCILVAEPTVFGAHNLSMVHELVKLFKKPYGVVLNKTIGPENPSREFCLNNEIDIIGEFKYEESLAHFLSVGRVVAREDEDYKKQFLELLSKVYIQMIENKYSEV